MKIVKLLTILVFLINSFIIKANNKDSLLYEIGINIYSLRNIPVGIFTNYSYLSFDFDLKHYYINGITLKRYFNKNVFRIGIDYYKFIDKLRPDDDGCCDRIINDGEYEGVEIKIGYEKRLNIKHIIPFIGIDLIGVYGKYVGVAAGGLSGHYYAEYNITHKKLGLAPYLGFNVKFRKHFSASIETNFNISYYQNKDIIKDSDQITKNWGRRYNPLRIVSFNYHF